METIAYHQTPCKIHPLNISYVLRMGYLFSDNVIAAGTIFYGLLYLKLMENQSLEEKLDFIERHTPPEGVEDLPDLKEMAQHSKVLLKALRKIKHPRPDQIIYRRKVEKGIDGLFKTATKDKVLEQLKTMLPQLQSMVEKDEIEVYSTHFSTPETDHKKYEPASSVLLNELEEEGGRPLMYLMPIEVFHPEWRKHWSIVKANHSRAAKAKNTYFSKCFSISNLNVLTPDELRAVRLHIAPALPGFMEKMNDWLNLFKEGAPAADTTAFLNKAVLPQGEAIGALLGSNGILQHTDQLMKGARFDIFLGEMPLYAVWDFYKAFDGVHDSTWQKLEEARKNKTFDGKRVPVMTFHVSDAKDDIWSREEEEPLTGKKSLSID